MYAIRSYYVQGSTLFNSGDLRVQSGYRTSYLMFDLSSVSNEITKVELNLSVGSDAGSGTVNINLGGSNNWTESTLSTSNAPASGTQLGSLNATYSVGSTYTFTLDKSQITGGGNISLIVTQAAGGNDVSFASSEYSNSLLAPVLKVTTTNSTIVTEEITSHTMPSTIIKDAVV